MAHLERVIVLVDMDCFYCQVEEKLNPEIQGKPIAVVQYNAWRGGGIIAVNYPARDNGVTRHMRGEEAQEKCPEIVLCKVPNVRGKADLTKYRDAGKEVAEVLQSFTSLLERASVDEAYLDITELVTKRVQNNFEPLDIAKIQSTHVVGHTTSDFLINSYNSRQYNESNFKLAVGGLIAEEIRAEVYKQTGYKCSAGISHNKVLAKLVCGLHKPNQQTILPHESVELLYKSLPVRKIKSLGGKFGNAICEDLKIEFMAELQQFTERELAKRYDEKNANWLYNIARGIDMEPVTTRLVSKSIGCCKRFPGRNALTTDKDIEHWLSELALEISERLEKDVEENNRKAKQMVVSYAQEINKKDVSSSRTTILISYEQNKITQTAFDIVRKNCKRSDGTYCVKFLGISASNFEEIKKVRAITSFFKTENTSRFQIEPKAETTKRKGLTDYFQNMSNTNEKEEDEVEDDKDSSIYSASTEELNEDLDNLVYYQEDFRYCTPEQTNPCSLATTVLTTEENKDEERCSSPDSITEELSSEILKNEGKEAQTSFFKRYFIDHGYRGFDTSKIFDDEELASDTSDEENNEILEERTLVENEENVETSENSSNSVEHREQEITSRKNQKRDIVKRNIFDSTSSRFNDTKVSCPQCNKMFFDYDLLSHMDYHFALDIVREEAHIYKITPESDKNTKDVRAGRSRSGVKGTKRKIFATPLKEIKNSQTNALNLFLNNKPVNVIDEANLSDTERENSKDGKVSCSECNKMFYEIDLPSHMDYHFALNIVKDEAHIYKIKPKDVEEVTKETEEKETKKNYKVAKNKSPNNGHENSALYNFVKKGDGCLKIEDTISENNCQTKEAKNQNPNIANTVNENSLELCNKQKENIDKDLRDRNSNSYIKEKINSETKFIHEQIEDNSHSNANASKNTEGMIKLNENGTGLSLNLKGNDDIDKIPCPECSKLIFEFDMVSHMDYHFALNIAKEEKTYTPTSKPADPYNKDAKGNKFKGNKRKLNEAKASYSLDLFLNKKADSLTDTNSEVCKLCNKKITIEDFSSHLDYHEAKRIHFELNQQEKIKESTKVEQKIENSNNKNSISSFFKPKCDNKL